MVDGIDIRSIGQADLRAKIGYVPQQAILFSGSIRDNILFGKDKGEAEVAKAAEIAQATEFIRKTPAGFAADIAQGGKNISGGQKQRLAIARALVHKPKIYIFDECFSALDFKTDAKLRAALKEETANATVIIIAQRVSTIKDADQIIVLEKGRIAGIGTHGELLATNNIYREIVSFPADRGGNCMSSRYKERKTPDLSPRRGVVDLTWPSLWKSPILKAPCPAPATPQAPPARPGLGILRRHPWYRLYHFESQAHRPGDHHYFHWRGGK